MTVLTPEVLARWRTEAEEIPDSGLGRRIIALLDALEARVTVSDEPQRERGLLWQALDWTFWGVGMGDVIREPLADKMIAALTDDEWQHATALIHQFDFQRGGPAARNYYEELKAENEKLTAAPAPVGDPADVAARRSEVERLREVLRLTDEAAKSNYKNAMTAITERDRLREVRRSVAVWIDDAWEDGTTPIPVLRRLRTLLDGAPTPSPYAGHELRHLPDGEGSES